MPSRARLASATAAGVVGLVVAGLILFGTDPLGTGSTTIAVPASPNAAYGSSSDTEWWEENTGSGADRPSTDPTATAGTPGAGEKSGATKAPKYRPATTYGPPPVWGEEPPKRTTRPRPFPRPTYAPPRPSTSPTTTKPKPKPTTAPPTSTRPSATASRTPSAEPSATAATPSEAPTASPSSSAASESPTPAAGTYEVRRDWAGAVLDRLNAQRAEHGLPALTSNDTLVAAAHTHNVKMADADELSHQLPGEPGLGERISAAGYSWSGLGENVAWSSTRSEAGVLDLQDAMYNETPPNDGHRKNILSDSFTEVGIDVIVDAEHGKVWLVTDFGKP